MIDVTDASGFDRGDAAGVPSARAMLSRLVWLLGLLSTIYLVGWASLLVFYSIGFSSYLSPHFEWRKVWLIGMDAIPLCCFAAIGLMGLTFWPRGRLRLWGLSAILLQIALTIYVSVHPLGVLVLVPGFR